MSPQQVDAMSPWQFAAAVAGWNKVHGSEPKPEAMSEEEFDDLLERHG